MRRIWTLLILAATAAGCGAPSMVVERPQEREVNGAVTALWARDVRRVARTGDWILTRSYSAVGDVITLSTSGESLSHGAIYDAERRTVIEAINPAVREVPLENLLARNRYAIVLRPSGLSEEQRLASVARARAAIGARFDYLGVLGIGDAERFYCSELLVWASVPDADERLVAPSDLLGYGEVVYFSGARDDRQLQGAAVAAASRRRARSTDEAAQRIAARR